jgi:hypothetical protein
LATNLFSSRSGVDTSISYLFVLAVFLAMVLALVLAVVLALMLA